MDKKLVYVTPLFAPPTRQQVEDSLTPFAGLLNAYERKLVDNYRNEFGTDKITTNEVLEELGEMKIVGQDLNTAPFQQDHHPPTKQTTYAKHYASYKQTPKTVPSPSIFDKPAGIANIIVEETQFPLALDSDNHDIQRLETILKKYKNTKETLIRPLRRKEGQSKEQNSSLSELSSHVSIEKKVVSQNSTQRYNQSDGDNILRSQIIDLTRSNKLLSPPITKCLPVDFCYDAEVIIPKLSLREMAIVSQDNKKNNIGDVANKLSQNDAFNKTLNPDGHTTSHVVLQLEKNRTQARNVHSSELNLLGVGSRSFSKKCLNQTNSSIPVIDLTKDTCERTKPNLTRMKLSDNYIDDEYIIDEDFGTNSIGYSSRHVSQIVSTNYPKVLPSRTIRCELDNFSLDKNYAFHNKNTCVDHCNPSYDKQTCEKQNNYIGEVCTMLPTACCSLQSKTGNQNLLDNRFNITTFNSRTDICRPSSQFNRNCISLTNSASSFSEDEDLMSVSTCGEMTDSLYRKSPSMGENSSHYNPVTSKLQLATTDNLYNQKVCSEYNKCHDVQYKISDTASPTYSPLTSLDSKSSERCFQKYSLPSKKNYKGHEELIFKDPGLHIKYDKLGNQSITSSNKVESNVGQKILIHNVISILPKKKPEKIYMKTSLAMQHKNKGFSGFKQELPCKTLTATEAVNNREEHVSKKTIIAAKQKPANFDFSHLIDRNNTSKLKNENELLEIHQQQYKRTSTETLKHNSNYVTNIESNVENLILVHENRDAVLGIVKDDSVENIDTISELAESSQKHFDTNIDDKSSPISSDDWCVSQDFMENLFGMQRKLRNDSIKQTLKNNQDENNGINLHNFENLSPLSKDIKRGCKSSTSKTKKQLPTVPKQTGKPSGKASSLKANSNTKITDFFSSSKGISAKNPSKANIFDLTKAKCEEQQTVKRKAADVACISATRKKKKYVTPAVSQFEEIDPLSDVFSLKDKTAIELLDKLSLQTPFEICFDVIFDNQHCQLSIPSTFKKAVTPVGLMFSVRWKPEEDEEFYYMSTFSKWSNIENAGRLVVHLLSEDPACTKVCYDAKQLYVYLRGALCLECEETACRWRVWDVMVGCWLLDPDRPSASFGGALAILGMRNDKRVTSSDPLLAACPLLQLLSTGGRTMRVLLRARGLWSVFADIEMRVVSCLAAMERRGIMVLEDELSNNNVIMHEKLKRIEKDAHDIAGVDFKINSTVQLRRILYDMLELDKKTKGRIGTTAVCGEKSTSEDTLLQLREIHPLPELVLEFRHINKARSTYVEAIAKCSSNGIVRATWTQTGTATGRISCSNPNLQAIPKGPFPLVLFPVKNQPPPPHLNLRSSFIARSGFTLISADFRHIEFRVFASLAQDEKLLKLFTQEEDVFLSLSKLLGEGDISVTSEHREKTKKFVYAIIYGAGVNKLKAILGCSLEEAKSMKERFGNKFRAFKDFGRLLVSEAQRHGHLSSLSGRRRLFPNIRSTDVKVRQQAERQAINFVIQGSAADICKAVMVESEIILRSKYSNAYHLVLQIHDELVWEVNDRYLQDISAELQELLNGGQTLCKKFPQLKVPLPVNICTGKKWGTLEKLPE